MNKNPEEKNIVKEKLPEVNNLNGETKSTNTSVFISLINEYQSWRNSLPKIIMRLKVKRIVKK